MSLDGRILVHSRGDAAPPYNVNGWYVNCFRPEAVTTDSRGIAQFPLSAASPPSGPWSVGLSIEANVTPPTSGRYLVGKQHFSKQSLSMCPDPNHRDKSCPFPSDSSGVAGQPGTAGGSYDTYLMMVVAPDEWVGIDTSLPNDVDWPVFIGDAGSRVNPIGMRFLRVTVQNPRTAIATPSSWSVSQQFEVLKWSSALYGEVPVLGIEPTLSLDGRLLVFQGNVSNNFRWWNAENTEGDQLMYTFNPQPGVPTGWSQPRPINEMYANEQNTFVNGVPFARLYPIAAAPMTMANGGALTQPFAGAYPWMTLDATDLVFSAVTNPGVQSRRFAMSIVGRSTGYSVRHIDGPLNPDRVQTLRIITTGTGAAPGIWAWGGDRPGLNLPYTRLGRSIPLLTMHIREYAEISVNEAVDGDYLLAWDMNEFVMEDASLGWKLDLARTPDTSGHRITGNLVAPEARFHEDWGAVPPDEGASGQFILCTDLGAVMASDPVLNASLPAMTAECWFWCTPEPEGQSFPLIQKAGSYALAADRQGRVIAQVTTTALGTLQSPVLGAPINGAWRHVAMTYDSEAVTGVGVTGRFRVYIDGAQVHEQTVAPGAQVSATSSTLIVGPAGLTGSGGMVGIDQVRLSRVERTADEIARAAFAIPASSGLQQLPFALPLGLDPAETKVPASNIPSRDAIDLGEILFHDRGLSGDTTKSCALCHESTQLRSFTDGIAQRLGFGGTGTLLRNAPTVLNRVFSTEQFWDGHAEHLEAQVLFPLFSPEEMGADINQLLIYLNASDDYVARFAAAYAGALPSIPLLQNALASYQRALVAGDSNADRYEDGQVGTLSASEVRGRHLFFGKARCFGCHSGSNYSDERYHVSVEPSVVTGSDPGRKGFTDRERDLHRFKTPTLRNLVDTAPYFHRGQANSLAIVIDRYNAGGATGHFDEEIFPLGLTSAEKADLEDFLRALSGVWIKL